MRFADRQQSFVNQQTSLLINKSFLFKNLHQTRPSHAEEPRCPTLPTSPTQNRKSSGSLARFCSGSVTGVSLVYRTESILCLPSSTWLVPESFGTVPHRPPALRRSRRALLTHSAPRLHWAISPCLQRIDRTIAQWRSTLSAWDGDRF